MYKNFKKYEEELKEHYALNPIDISIGFFAMCSYQYIAWDYVFESIRKYYPDAPIVLLNDGMEQYDYTEMAIKYNCIYIKKNKNICLLWNDLTDTYEFLHRLKEACELLKTEWLINLHPDVICQNKISYNPQADICGVSAGSNTGISCNNFDNNNEWKKIKIFIQKFNSNVELNGWGWCGGGIMKIKTFIKIYNNLYSDTPIVKLEEINNTYKEAVRYEDTLLPILFNIYGYNYRIWKDNPEFHRNNKIGAFLHGYKAHYDFVKNGKTIQEFNNSRLEKSLK